MIQIKRMPIKSKEFGYKHFSTIATLIHAGCNRYCNSTLSITNVQSCHQIRQTRFIENPFQTLEEAEEIITLANDIMLRDKWDMWNDLILLLSQLKT
jgi:hypothetical protein